MTIMEKSVVVRESIVIEASPDRVWEAFSRLDDWPRWSPKLGQPRFVKGTPWKKGSEVEFVIHRLGGRTQIRAQVVECYPQRQVMWVGNRFGIHGQHAFVFEPEGSSTTALTTVAFSGPMLGLLSLVLPERRVRDMFATWLKGLKSTAESGGA